MMLTWLMFPYMINYYFHTLYSFSDSFPHLNQIAYVFAQFHCRFANVIYSFHKNHIGFMS